MSGQIHLWCHGCLYWGLPHFLWVFLTFRAHAVARACRKALKGWANVSRSSDLGTPDFSSGAHFNIPCLFRVLRIRSGYHQHGSGDDPAGSALNRRLGTQALLPLHVRSGHVTSGGINAHGPEIGGPRWGSWNGVEHINLPFDPRHIRVK